MNMRIRTSRALLLALLACLGAGASARELLQSLPWCTTGRMPVTQFCAGPSRNCVCSPKAFRSQCNIDTQKCQVATRDCTTSFAFGSNNCLYDWFFYDLVTGNVVRQPQLTSTQACACGCLGEASCDGWMFYEPSNSYYEDYPGCSFIDIKDSATDSPASFPASDFFDSQDYRFWVRNGKYTIPPC